MNTRELLCANGLLDQLLAVKLNIGVYQYSLIGLIFVYNDQTPAIEEQDRIEPKQAAEYFQEIEVYTVIQADMGLLMSQNHQTLI